MISNACKEIPSGMDMLYELDNFGKMVKTGKDDLLLIRYTNVECPSIDAYGLGMSESNIAIIKSIDNTQNYLIHPGYALIEDIVHFAILYRINDLHAMILKIESCIKEDDSFPFSVGLEYYQDAFQSIPLSIIAVRNDIAFRLKLRTKFALEKAIPCLISMDSIISNSPVYEESMTDRVDFQEAVAAKAEMGLRFIPLGTETAFIPAWSGLVNMNKGDTCDAYLFKDYRNYYLQYHTNKRKKGYVLYSFMKLMV